MTLVKVNPLSRSLDGMIKDFINEFPSTLSKTMREDVLFFPPVNIHENETSYLVDLSVPGFEKADFNIKLDGNVLSISTEKTENKEESGAKLIRREFSNKAFKRSFTIDDKIDGEKINAKYENGILMIELPKKEIAKVVAKEINVQ
jgi:HSP20 family protein